MLQVSLEQVNAFVLRKQHLTPDSTYCNIPTIVKDICGLHATGPTVPYLSLFARYPNFEKTHLEEELYKKKRLAKIRCVRKTIYIQAKEMLPIVHGATATFVEKASRRFMESRGITPDEYEQLSKHILGLLSEKEMTASEIKKALYSSSEISSVLYFMCDQGLLIRGRPERGWRDKNQRYVLFTDYFPDLDLTRFEEKEAVRLLIERYLASFGPVTESDILWWTGLGKTVIRQALEELDAKVTNVSIAELGDRYILLHPEIEPLLKSYAQSNPTICLLPYLDPYLMGYRERGRYLNPQHTTRVFDRSGNATSTILVNGSVVGVWDFDEKAAPSVKLHFFSQPSPDILAGVRHEATRLAKFISEEEAALEECNVMTPLTDRSAGGFMSPLRQV
jgi:hypothetical protein